MANGIESTDCLEVEFMHILYKLDTNQQTNIYMTTKSRNGGIREDKEHDKRSV